jgi:hypothetical protein
MTTSPSQPPFQWGERTALLDKTLAYVFSMDLAFTLRAPNFGSIGPLGQGIRAVVAFDRGSTFHVLDEVLVTTPDGVVRDVPSGDVQRVDDRMVIDGAGTATLDGRVLLNVDGPISIAYTGIATFRGGADRVLSAALADNGPSSPLEAGSAYISLRSECERPKYRWMVENQLFGWGRVRVTREAGAACRLSYSYDVYGAG